MRPIDDELKQILTDLVIEQNSRRGWAPSGAQRQALVDEVEDALIDRNRLEPILSHLGALPNTSLQRSDSVFATDDDVRAVLDGGLKALYARSEALFYSAVVDPFALMELRDNIFDSLPPYWWEKIKHAGGREPETAETAWDKAVAAAQRELELTSFDQQDGPRRWTVTLEGDRVTRVAPAGTPAPQVTLEFTLTPDPPRWRLEVDVLDPPPSSDRRRSGWLASASGMELARVDDASDLLTFSVTQDDLRAGVVFHCDDRRGGDDSIRYFVPVTPV